MMQYRGLTFTIRQEIDRGPWKWAVDLPERRRHGEAATREEALVAVKKAVDDALRVKE
jgi:hypothetical protein